ncbi:hypothetical protein PIB30_082012 [Stylosanthes scabra]|uniref:Uncharacterized protein n=1 Tax=Stylosanthes scabra TaxID=79078 RepID=A0ABU6TRD7_9FABA|nr:hypothetical protein [Stylosanthes scabra]
MARNITGAYVIIIIIIIILIIGEVICSENVELQKTIIERPWTTLYPTASKKSSSSSKPKQTVEECVKKCRKLKHYEESLNCIFNCVFSECSLRFPNVKDRKSWMEKESCIGTLFAKYDILLHS